MYAVNPEVCVHAPALYAATHAPYAVNPEVCFHAPALYAATHAPCAVRPEPINITTDAKHLTNHKHWVGQPSRPLLGYSSPHIHIH